MYYDYNLNNSIKNMVFETCTGHKLTINNSLTKHDLSVDDVVFVASENDKQLFEGYKVICWEELEKECIKEANNRIDYSYLRCKMERAKNEATRIIAIGSSYMQFGLAEGVIDNCVNLSLSGMDIYYCNKIIRDICDHNNNIKYIMLSGGYYYFHADMSRNTKGAICKHILSQVLYPIFGDMHNAACIANSQSFLPNSSIVDMDKFFLYIIDNIWRRNNYDYFFPNRDRKFCRMLRNDNNEIISWTEYMDKDNFCKGYVDNESKYYSHNESFQENIAIFHDLMAYCKERGITPIIVQFPGSRCGYEQGTLEYRGQFYDTLDLFDEGPIHVLDFMGMDIFDENDFSDASHLSDAGAQKITTLINDILINDIISEQ